MAEKEEPATCTKPGKTALIKCAKCETVLQEQREIPKADHKEVLDEGKEPTCTEPGLTAGSHCETCGAVLKTQEVIPATGHVEYVAEEEVKATCMEPVGPR